MSWGRKHCTFSRVLLQHSHVMASRWERGVPSSFSWEPLLRRRRRTPAAGSAEGSRPASLLWACVAELDCTHSTQRWVNLGAETQEETHALLLSLLAGLWPKLQPLSVVVFSFVRWREWYSRQSVLPVLQNFNWKCGARVGLHFPPLTLTKTGWFLLKVGCT